MCLRLVYNLRMTIKELIKLATPLDDEFDISMAAIAQEFQDFIERTIDEMYR